jgi:hypothetical protein
MNGRKEERFFEPSKKVLVNHLKRPKEKKLGFFME